MKESVKKENNSEEKKLEGWRQIASYLDLDVRSAQRKEKMAGLPVHREDDTPKARVYTFSSELDQWRSEKTIPPAHRSQEKRDRRYLKYYIGIPIIAVVALAAAYFIFQSSGDHQPVAFRIVGSELVILNENKTTLWRHDTHIEDLASEEEYREHFQARQQRDGIYGKNQPLLIIKDLDQDGRKEVLFATFRKDFRPPAEVILFNERGKILFRFKAGKEMKYGASLYSDYRVSGIFTSDLDNDGNAEIVVNSNHYEMFPSSFTILNLKGKVIGEYWNSGRMMDFIFTDINKDGRKDIVVGAQNNEYNKGCVIVFDSLEVFGGSPQEQPYYTCNSIKKGSEKYYILFPRTEIETLPKSCCFEVFRSQNDRVRAVLAETALIYEFDPRFELKDILTSNVFDMQYEKGIKEGIFKNELKEDYLKKLATKIRYYNGKEWTSKPSLANYW